MCKQLKSGVMAASAPSQRCQYSYATIQSDPKGQFGQLIQKIQDLPDYDDHLQRFEALESEKQRLHYVNTNFLHCITLVPIFKKKDQGDAEASKEEGNKLFQTKKFSEALARYNRCVIRADIQSQKGSDLVALAVANRSACSFHLGNFEDAISDIQLAFALGYPMERRAKLYIRLAKSYLNSNQHNKAIGPLNVAKAMMTEDSDEIVELDKRIQRQSNSVTLKVPEQDYSVQDPHQSLDGFSSALEVTYTSSTGRYVKARADIACGETIVSEDAFASALNPDRFGSHCQSCLKALTVVIPCQACSGVAFCSVLCRDSAQFHSYECSFNDVMIGFGCSQIARLALRIMTKNTFDYFLQLQSHLRTSDETEPVSCPSSRSYVQVFNLVSNNDHRWPEDRLRRSLMAGVLLKVLKDSHFIPSTATMGEELFIGSLLTRNMEVLQFNAHEVYEVVKARDQKALTPCKTRSIGLAVYPHASYFNHSCQGSVARFFRGDKMYLKTLRSMTKGQEVCENYGSIFYFKDRRARQQELSSRYWFQCRCEACQEDWPLLEKLPKDPNKLETLQKIHDQMVKGSPDAVLEHLATNVTHTMPDATQVRIQDKLRTTIANLGNTLFANVVTKSSSNKDR